MRFAIPSICSLVLHGCYSIIDRIFIGQGIGPLGLAGVAMSFPILLLIFGVCLLFSSGSAALISIYLGEDSHNKAEQVLGNVASLILITSVIMTGVGFFFCDHILHLFHVPVDIFPYAHDYMRVIFSGISLFLIGFAMSFIIRAEGNPLYSTFLIVIATLSNALMDYIFIFKFGLGMRGAALATIISEAIVVVLGLYYILSKKGIIRLRLRHFKLDPIIVKRICFIGLSPAIMDAVACLQISTLNKQLAIHGGNLAVAAMGIVFSIASLMMLFTFGMAGGMQPIIGYNYGAGQFKRVKQTYLYALTVTILISIAFICVILRYADFIVAPFCKNDIALQALSSDALKTFLFFIPLGNITILTARYFQALGKTITSILVGMARQLIIFIPTLFIFSRIKGLEGIWLSGPTTDLLAITVTMLFIVHEMKTLNRQHKLRS